MKKRHLFVVIAILIIFVLCAFFVNRYKMIKYAKETALLMENDMNGIIDSSKWLFSELDTSSEEDMQRSMEAAFEELNGLTYNIMSGIVYKKDSQSYVYLREKTYLGFSLLGQYGSPEQLVEYGFGGMFISGEATAERINDRIIEIYSLVNDDELPEIPTFYSTGTYDGLVQSDLGDYGMVYIPLDEDASGTNHIIVVFDREKWVNRFFAQYSDHGYGYGISQETRFGDEIIYTSSTSPVQRGDVEIQLPGVTWLLDIFPVG